MKRGTKPKTFLEKLALHTEVDSNGCWNWGGKVQTNGYAIVWDEGKEKYGHRLSYLTFFGEIDPTLVIDHLCSNRRCINPHHLEQVTASENSIRAPKLGIGRPGYRATHCKRGHEFTDDNTYIYRNRQNCRTCRRMLRG